MKLKNILICSLIALALAPVGVFARGPSFSFSLNMFTPPRPCVFVHPCPPPPPPPCVVTYYPSYVVYPYYHHTHTHVVHGHYHHGYHHHGYHHH